MQTTLSVLGGLTITVEFCIEPADESVGIMSEGVDWHISHIAGRPVKNTPVKWLYRRIEGATGESDKIEQACFDAWREIKREAYKEPDYE